jgi:outer membrane receptor protein involved in Fe transport
MNPRFLSIVFTCLLLATCLTGFARTVLKGKVTGPQQEAVTAQVQLLKSKDSTTVQTFLTDTMGHILIDIPEDNKHLFLEITAIGYTAAYYTIPPVINDTITLDIVLPIQATTLNNVTISSKSPLLERKVDRIVFNVANSIAANGSDVYELLKKTPGVQVSHGEISMTGKSTVSIMINERLVETDGDELEALLRSMPSTDISKIEVITAPPAKNDAQGNSGIINIVTKKTRKNGLNGTVTGSYEQRKKGSEQLDGTFNYRKDKLNVYGNTSMDNMRFVSLQQTNTTYPGQQQLQTLQQDNRPLFSYSQLGADYNLSSNAVLGLLYTHGTLDGKRDEAYNNAVLQLPSLHKDSTLLTNAFAKDRGRRNVFNLNYEWKIDSSGKKLTVNADYFTRKGNKDRAFTTGDFFTDGSSTGTASDNRTYGIIKTDITTVHTDYEMPTTFATFSTGLKASLIHNNSDNVFTQLSGTDYIVDPTKTNAFDYRENTEAAYVSAQKTLGKWSMQLGFRGEYTQTKGFSENLSQTNTNDYFKLFPTAYLQYKPNENHSWNINYSRRIDRPSFWIMNPFRVYSTETSYEEGNPFLQPAFSNNFELGYSYKSIFAMTVFTQRVTDVITRVSYIDTLHNAFNFGQANAGTVAQYGMTATLSLQPIPCWESTTQLFGSYNKFNSILYSAAVSYGKPSFSVETHNTFTLNTAATLLAELGFSYTSSQQSDFDIQRHFCNLSSGLKALLLKKQLILTLDVEDILKTDIWQVTNLYNGTYQNSYFDNRLLRIGLTWKFGNRGIQAKRELNIDAAEMKRAG